MANGTTEIENLTNPITAFWRRPLVQAFISDPITLVSGAFLTLIFLAALFAPFVAPHDPTDRQLPLRHLDPFSSGVAADRSESPPADDNRFYIIGTDHLGRDMLSRLVYGARISLGVGVLGVLVSGFLGLGLGLLSGYYRGLADDVIMRTVDVFMSVPIML